jgi:cysteine-rich repeat protein
LPAAVVAFVLAAPAAVLALPDIVPEIYDVTIGVRNVDQEDVDEGCAGGSFNRRLVEFSLRTYNVGTTDLFLGDPGCPNCALNPGATCSNPLFVCGESHGHAHFESFAKTQILDSGMNLVAEGLKYGFCLLDLECADPQYSCSFQGISAGCSDVYEAGLPCQYVDITDAALPDGEYTLRVSLDPDGVFTESNEVNNTVDVPITIGATPPICSEYVSDDVPKAIPDLGSAVSTLAVPDLGPITSIRVRMAGQHDFISDVRATLASPASTDVVLMDQVCDDEQDFDVYLGDEGAGPIVCPPTDPSMLREPSESLAPFVGEEAAGDWTLTVSDLASADTGSLESWSLEVCSTCGNGELDPGEACDDGNAVGGDCCAFDCQSATGEGSPCDDGDACTIGGTCTAGACVPDDATTCDPCLVCDGASGCVVPGIIYPCQDPGPGKSSLTIGRDALDPADDSVRWKWKSQTPVDLNEFGAPAVSTELTLCIYDGDGLVLSSTIPAAGTCNGKPCWEVKTKNATFSDKSAAADGITSLKVKEGKTGQIQLRGKGLGLGAPGLPLSGSASVRLIRSDGTPCWEAAFSQSTTNTDTRFKGKSD